MKPETLSATNEMKEIIELSMVLIRAGATLEEIESVLELIIEDEN